MLGLLVLSGGQGRRSGGADKGWCRYQDSVCIRTVINQLEQQRQDLNQPSCILISANRNIEAYEALGYEVVSDQREGYQGPLAGIEAVMSASENLGIQRWLICPVDSPELPQVWLSTIAEYEEEEVRYLQADGRNHYTHVTLPADALPSIQAYLDGGQRSMKGWLLQQGAKPLRLASERLETPILNLNYL